jgi:PAS domain S-box-containing protein
MTDGLPGLNEARHADILAAYPDCIAILTADGRVLQINAAWLALLERRRSQDKVETSLYANLWPETERAAIQEAIQAAVKGIPTSIESLYRPTHGAPRHCKTRFYAVTSSEGHIEVLALTRDLSTPVAAAPHSDSRVYRLVDLAVEGLAEVDEEGRWRFINATGAQLLGYDSAVLIGQANAVAHQPGAHSPDDCPICRALQTRQPQYGTGRMLWHRDGGSLPMSYSVIPIADANGGAMVRFTDESERVRLESALRERAAELAAGERRKIEFIATLAHELRNPLAPIRSALQIMRTTKDNATSISHLREIMERQLGQMVNLVDGLLDVARVTSGQVTLKKDRIVLQDILNLALEASAPLMKESKLVLKLEIPGALLLLDADATRLTQVFTNILDNAARYSASGSRITVRVENRIETVLVDIGDSGLGITPEALEGIFEMFARVVGGTDSHGGLGIGLHLARRLIEMHNGTLIARSEGRGRGSHFLVTLPLAQSVARVAEGDRPSPPAPRPVRALIVDDNIDAAVCLSMLLDLGGHATRIAHNGTEALKIASDFKPLVIFLDIGMPEMNGYEVARALRSMRDIGHPVLVAVTGWGAPEDRVQSKNAGFDEHLTKPVDISTIELLLARLSTHPNSVDGNPTVVNGDKTGASV